ncbi:MAG: MMPL family transporter [Pirellulales bacterium]|nr:MMPL family transporter [Pirellulales bacterium]
MVMQKPAFFTKNAFLLLLVAIFLLPIVLRGARIALENNKNDVKAWLPDGFEETRELDWFREQFLGDQFVVISWPGCTLEDPRIEKLAQALVPPHTPETADLPQRKFFKSVITGPQVLAQMTDPKGNLKLKQSEALDRMQGALIGPDGETTCLVATLTNEAEDNLRAGLGNSWPLTRILMGREDGLLFKIASESCGLDKSELRIGGPPVDNVAIDDEGEITLMRLVGLSALVGLGLSYYCFRSKRVTAMVFFCGVYGAACSLMIVYVTGGLMDAVLLVLPSLVYVLGLSGAIHLINYYQDEVEEAGLEGAPGRALRAGWLPCTLAAVTTALGLGSLITSEVIPIRKFGIYSAYGVLFTLVVLFALLPTLLQLWPPRQKKKVASKQGQVHSTPFSKLLLGMGDMIINRHAMVSILCLILLLVLGAGLVKTKTTVQLMKLFDPGSNIIRNYTWLEENLGNLVPMEVVLRMDHSRMRQGSEPILSADGHYRLSMLERMEMVERIQKRIEQLPDVGRALSMVTFAPELPEQANSLGVFTERSGYNSALQKHRQDFLEEDYFRADDSEELFRVSARLPALSDVDYGQFVEEIRYSVMPLLAAYRERERIISTLAQPGESLRGKRVCLVGTPVDMESGTLVDIEGSPEAIEVESRNEMMQSLGDLLRVAGVRVTSIKQATAGQKQKQTIGANQEHPKAAAYFKKFDLVYFAAAHPAVADDFIKRHAKQVIDARNLRPLETTREEEQAGGIWPVYTGVVPLVYKAQRTLLVGLINSILLAFVLICVLMMAILRSPTAGLLSMIPNVFPIVVIFGFMGWIGALIDIGTMMTASVAMGVAVDDTVHFLTWFRRGIIGGLDRRGAVRMAYARCATAMIETTIIGGLGLGVFALSTFTPTQRFGYLMMFLLAAALVGDLIFLPALLTGPLGKLFTRGLEQKVKNEQSSNRTTGLGNDTPNPAIPVPYSAQTSRTSAAAHDVRRQH